MFTKGVPQAEVARRLKVSRQSVSRWYRTWTEEGKAALVDAGRAGRPPRLTADQKARVEEELLRGPTAHGYATQLWTLARVAEVIQRVTGVRYHPGHVWRLLHELGWSVQRPARRAAERDQEAIARWVKEDWPRVKKRPTPPGLDRLQDESGVSLTPVVRATWAPRGQTPVLRHKFNWKRMSMSAALCYRPDRSAAELVFATQPGAYNTETLIDFLGRLHAHLGRDAKITLLWDGLSSHRSRDMTAFIACCRGWLRVERLPAYAPRTQPGRRPVGQRQRNRTGQPLPRHHRRGDAGRVQRTRPRRQRHRSVLRAAAPHRSFPLIKTSLNYANLFKFFAVGQGYRNFRQTSDDEVIALLDRA